MRAYRIFTFVLFGSISMVGQVPVGTVIPAKLNSSIDTAKNKPGDRISTRVMQDLPLTDSNKVPAGARLVGKIVEVQPGNVSWKFDALIVHKKWLPIGTTCGVDNGQTFHNPLREGLPTIRSARGRPMKAWPGCRFDYLLLEPTGSFEPPPVSVRGGRRTALTFPVGPPPQKMKRGGV